MNIAFDFDSRVLSDSPTNRTAFSSLTAKRGAKGPVVVRVVRNGTVIELPEDATAILGILAKGDFGGDYLASAFEFVKAGSGSNTTYTFFLNLDTEEMDALFEEEGTEISEELALELVFSSTSGNIHLPSIAVPFFMENAYVTGSGDPALANPDLRATEEEAIAGASNTRWMTPLRTRQAMEAFLDDAIGEEIPGLEGGKIPTSYLPDSIVGQLEYQGGWNASTNTPAIPAAASGNRGHYYVVTTAGATSINGQTDWLVGDWLVSNGTTWDKVDNTEAPFATNAEVRTGTDATKKVSPANMGAVYPKPGGVSKVLHVSKGSNATDTRTGIFKDDPDKPFATVAAAEAAVVAGETIWIHSGTYAESGLGKNGVTYILENATIGQIDATTAHRKTFDDKGTGCDTAILGLGSAVIIGGGSTANVCTGVNYDHHGSRLVMRNVVVEMRSSAGSGSVGLRLCGHRKHVVEHCELRPNPSTPNIAFTPVEFNGTYDYFSETWASSAAWTVLGPATITLSSGSMSPTPPYLQYGTGILRATLPSTVTGGWKLEFDGMLNAYSRTIWMAVLDATGKQGYGTKWNSGLVSQFQGHGSVNIQKFNLAAEPTTSDSGTDLGTNISSLLTVNDTTLAHFELTWEENGVLTLKCNGVQRMQVVDTSYSSFARIYLKGHATSYFDNIKLTALPATSTVVPAIATVTDCRISTNSGTGVIITHGQVEMEGTKVAVGNGSSAISTADNVDLILRRCVVTATNKSALFSSSSGVFGSRFTIHASELISSAADAGSAAINGGAGDVFKLSASRLSGGEYNSPIRAGNTNTFRFESPCGLSERINTDAYTPVVVGFYATTAGKLYLDGAEMVLGNVNDRCVFVSQDDPLATDARAGLNKSNRERPFLTIGAAQAATEVGDVLIVLPSSEPYQGCFNKDGLNVFGYPGATIYSQTDDEETALPAINDLESGSPVAMSMVIVWHGGIYAGNSTEQSNQHVIQVAHADSNITVFAPSSTIQPSGTGEDHRAVAVLDGRLFLVAKLIHSSDMDNCCGIYMTGGSATIRADVTCPSYSAAGVSVSNAAWLSLTGDITVSGVVEDGEGIHAENSSFVRYQGDISFCEAEAHAGGFVIRADNEATIIGTGNIRANTTGGGDHTPVFHAQEDGVIRWSAKTIRGRKPCIVNAEGFVGGGAQLHVDFQDWSGNSDMLLTGGLSRLVGNKLSLGAKILPINGKHALFFDASLLGGMVFESGEAHGIVRIRGMWYSTTYVVRFANNDDGIAYVLLEGATLMNSVATACLSTVSPDNNKVFVLGGALVNVAPDGDIVQVGGTITATTELNGSGLPF